jgi:DNA-directed RNA polymerase alpha subunit
MSQFFISCKESKIENNRSFYGCFNLGPFEPSQSITIANALRRTLLSELYGLSIVSVEIEGATHEYSNLNGIKDSVLDILLNLKEIIFKKNSNYQTLNLKSDCLEEIAGDFVKNINSLGHEQGIKSQIGYLKARGPGIVRASNLRLPPFIQCVDPDQYIATLAEDGFLNIKFIIQYGNKWASSQSQNSRAPASSEPRLQALGGTQNEFLAAKNLQKAAATSSERLSARMEAVSLGPKKLDVGLSANSMTTLLKDITGKEEHLRFKTNVSNGPASSESISFLSLPAPDEGATKRQNRMQGLQNSSFNLHLKKRRLILKKLRHIGLKFSNSYINMLTQLRGCILAPASPTPPPLGGMGASMVGPGCMVAGDHAVGPPSPAGGGGRGAFSFNAPLTESEGCKKRKGKQQNRVQGADAGGLNKKKSSTIVHPWVIIGLSNRLLKFPGINLKKKNKVYSSKGSKQNFRAKASKASPRWSDFAQNLTIEALGNRNSLFPFSSSKNAKKVAQILKSRMLSMNKINLSNNQRVPVKENLGGQQNIQPTLNSMLSYNNRVLKKPSASKIPPASMQPGGRPFKSPKMSSSLNKRPPASSHPKGTAAWSPATMQPEDFASKNKLSPKAFHTLPPNKKTFRVGGPPFKRGEMQADSFSLQEVSQMKPQPSSSVFLNSNPLTIDAIFNPILKVNYIIEVNDFKITQNSFQTSLESSELFEILNIVEGNDFQQIIDRKKDSGCMVAGDSFLQSDNPLRGLSDCRKEKAAGSFHAKDKTVADFSHSASIQALNLSLENILKIKREISSLKKEIPKHNIILEIWTNGSIHPRDAIYEGLKNLVKLFSKLNKVNAFIINPFLETSLSQNNILKDLHSSETLLKDKKIKQSKVTLKNVSDLLPLNETSFLSTYMNPKVKNYYSKNVSFLRENGPAPASYFVASLFSLPTELEATKRKAFHTLPPNKKTFRVGGPPFKRGQMQALNKKEKLSNKLVLFQGETAYIRKTDKSSELSDAKSSASLSPTPKSPRPGILGKAFGEDAAGILDAGDISPPFSRKKKIIGNFDIGILNLSLRSYTCLKRLNINTIDELIHFLKNNSLNRGKPFEPVFSKTIEVSNTKLSKFSLDEIKRSIFFFFKADS